MTHTPPEADLSPEGLRKLADTVAAMVDRGFEGHAIIATTDEERALKDVVSSLRALDDPPPADGAGLETTAEERAEWLREAIDGASVDYIFGDSPADVARLLRDFDKEHARAEGLAKEIERLKGEVYVPGQWRCPKCNFRLAQAVMRASDGAVGLRDDPGERCPNDGSPLWRVTEREAGNELAERAQEYFERANAAEAKLAVYEAPVGDGTPFDAWALGSNARFIDVFWSDYRQEWCVDGEDGESCPLPPLRCWRPLPPPPTTGRERG